MSEAEARTLETNILDEESVNQLNNTAPVPTAL